MADDDDDAVYRILRQHFDSADRDRDQDDGDDTAPPPLGNFWDFSEGMTWRTLNRYRARPWVDVTAGTEYTTINDGIKDDDTQRMAPPSLVFQEGIDGVPLPGKPLIILRLATWYGLPVAYNRHGIEIVPKQLARRMAYSFRIQRQMMRDLSRVIKDFDGSRVVAATTCDLGNTDAAKFNLLALRTRDGTTAELVVRYYPDRWHGSDGTMRLEPPSMATYSRGMASFSDTTRYNAQHVLNGYRDLMFKTPNFRVPRGPMDAFTTLDPRMAPHVRAMKTLREDPLAGELS